jgi:hypothetical protein
MAISIVNTLRRPAAEIDALIATGPGAGQHCCGEWQVIRGVKLISSNVSAAVIVYPEVTA